MTDEWYWCLQHRRAEPGPPTCPADARLGPYGSAEEAQRWSERVEARNEAWEADDERWHGREEE